MEEMQTSSSEGMLAPSNWLKQRFEKESKKDVIPMAERFGQIIGIVFIGIFIAYFAAHLSSNMGFFRPNFGAFEAVLFFGIGMYGILPAMMKFIFGRKNRVRPFDFMGNVLMLFAMIFFLAIWPFDFAHIADALASDLQFIVSWLSDQFMQILLIIGIPILVFVTVLELLTYFGVKEILGKAGPQPAIEPLLPK